MNISALFGFLLIPCLLVNRKQLLPKANHPTAFVLFQRRYLLVYALSMMAFWFQVSSILSLYQSYLMDSPKTSYLLVIEYLTSAIFGLFTGVIADKFGRKNSCLVYVVTYSISCVTKLSSSFDVLSFSHVMGGISTSILFSVFEAWMVCEHRKAGFSDELLSETFSMATLINGFIAIASGLLGDLLAGSFGFVSPFMAALACLVVVGFIIQFTWRENYGNVQFDLATTFSSAFHEVTGNRKIMALGLVQSMYELAVCSVLSQIPLLEYQVISVSIPGLPFGLVFGIYMISIMVGSAVFHYTIELHYCVVETLSNIVFSASSLMLVASIAIPENLFASLIPLPFFWLFYGIYMPCIGTMRGRYFKEECRATLMTLYRVPFSLFVVVVLIKAGSVTMATIFTVCFFGLILALITQYWLSRQQHIPSTSEFLTIDQNFVAKHN